MPSPDEATRRLPVARATRFACRRCGDCCRWRPVELTPAEAERLERDGPAALGRLGPVSATVRRRGRLLRFLRRRADGACIFLADPAECRLQTALGAEAKPLACRTYPWEFVPRSAAEAPPLLAASFTCSSVARAEGEGLTSQREEAAGLLEELEAASRLPPAPTPAFARALRYPREDLERLCELLLAEFEDARRPFPARALVAAKFLDLVAASRFPSLRTPTTRRQLDAFHEGIRAQTERGLLRAPTAPPSRAQRLLLGSLLARACRPEPPALATASGLRRAAHRLGDGLALLAFWAGSGLVQPWDRARRVVLGTVRRTAPRADPAAPCADAALTRYFVAKLSQPFLYAPHHALRTAQASLGLLLRVYPMALLLARAACLARSGTEVDASDYASALRTIDRAFARTAWDRGALGRLRARLLGDFDAALALVPSCAAPPPTPSAA
ncbi:MAG: YkgJ family cysteine cluster protein [Planctomycetota bacterium]|nr:MAG: YkgJ family cysteine cluster protein [Planctomycetota bacterium]